MKTFIVFSDIHGNYSAMEKLLPLINENSGAIFAGDGLNVAENFRPYVKGDFYLVRGNCDDCADESEIIIAAENVKIFLTHGHLYGVRNNPDKLIERAKALGCSVAIYGHTHIPLVEKRDGVTVINPGTCGNCCAETTFAYLAINGDKVIASINSYALADSLY